MNGSNMQELKWFGKDKHCTLLGLFVSYEENELL
jgi:hypothetical protein